MGPYELRLVAIFLIVLFGMLIFPAVVTILLHWKYGNRLPGKVATVFILGMILYYVAFFTYGPDLIPDSWRPVAHEVYQCEWKTVYVEKS